MKFKTIILSGLALATSMVAVAQETKTEYEFHPNWYVQGQFGLQYDLGEISFERLLSTNAQLSAGYNFTKIFGLRAGVNAWQSRGGWDDGVVKYDWKWNYVTPTLDAVLNLSNVLCGYNPERLFNLSVFGGLGMNIAFNNDEAIDVNKELQTLYPYEGSQPLRNLWDDTKVRMLGRLGVMADFRLSDNVSVGLELQANTLNDNYNSKKAGNSDWYFNGLVGVRYNFGKTYTKKTVKVPVLERPAQPQIVEKVVEKIVEKVVEAKKTVEVAPLRKDIFFTLSSSTIAPFEMQKVHNLANFLKQNPNTKVEITGYADKGTGNAKINMKFARKRAEMVKQALIESYGIEESRIVVSAKGDTEQPFEKPILNRVSVCIAK